MNEDIESITITIEPTIFAAEISGEKQMRVVLVVAGHTFTHIEPLRSSNIIPLLGYCFTTAQKLIMDTRSWGGDDDDGSRVEGNIDGLARS
jgi:hypothetical protein